MDRAIDKLAGAPSLLVCLDFDGTISELVTDPLDSRAHPDAVDAIRKLSELPRTQVAVLSGRHLDGLRAVFPLREPVVLVGCHGAEPAEGGPQLAPADADYLRRIESELKSFVVPPAFVEVKPYQRVMHVAALAERDPAAARALLDRALEVDSEGRPVTQGHNVVEFSALDITKGDWLADYKTGFDATLFAGDDTTDETALARLGSGDVGIKVGPKESVAQHRLAGVPEMAELLVRLARARREAQQNFPA